MFIVEVGPVLLVFGSLYLIFIISCSLDFFLVELLPGLVRHILGHMLQGFEICLFVETFEGYYVVTIIICNF